MKKYPPCLPAGVGGEFPGIGRTLPSAPPFHAASTLGLRTEYFHDRCPVGCAGGGLRHNPRGSGHESIQSSARGLKRHEKVARKAKFARYRETLRRPRPVSTGGIFSS